MPLCLLACAASAAELPRGAAGKIAPETWQRVEAGEARDLIVQFGDPKIDADLAAHMASRGLRIPDRAARTLRAERYAALRTRALGALAADDAALRRHYRHIPKAYVRFRDADALARLLQRGEVVAVYEDVKLRAVLTQSLDLVNQPEVAGVIGRTGSGTTVAVLDTGLLYTRSEFGACTAPGVPAGCRVVHAQDFAPDDGLLDQPPDGYPAGTPGHGTWVAGTVLGVAPGTRIAALDVFQIDPVSGEDEASSLDITEAIDWAIENRDTYNIVAINMSLGNGQRYTSPCSGYLQNPYRQDIIEARDAGILSIVASGNEGYTNGLAMPACTPEAISVGAVYDANVGAYSCDTTTAADKVTCFSNSASFLTMLAPGAAITVTGWAVGGTSFAAPHVAGAVAVLKAAYPSETAAQIQTRLTSTGKSVTDTRMTPNIVKPRLDLLAAQGAPVNDPFSAATILSGLSGQAGGWNFNASKETGEPNHAGNAGGKSVWWQWTAPSAGVLTLDTHGSGFDTLLGLYTGSGVSALTTVASNDNDGSANNASGLTAPVSAGTTYRIAVDGKSGASGAVTLNWSLQEPQAQSITFSPIDPQPVLGTLALTATASSGLDISFSTSTPAVCTVVGDQASFIAAGICTLHADQPGDGVVWLPAPQVSQSFTVNKLAQGIDFPAIADRSLDASPFTVSASASSGLTVSFASDTPGTCGVVGSEVTLITVGPCTLRASQAGSGIYEAATDVTVSFNVLSAGGGPGSDGDVPLPPWALLLLGGGLGTMLWRRSHKGDKT